RPIPGAHTIWELTQHIRAWEGACLRRLNGDPAQLPDSEDWVALNDFSEASWEQTKQGLIDTHNQLLEKISSLDDSRLDQPIMDHPEIPFSSTYVTLHGGVQHDLYHAGQIAILKKALGL
ncbi:MAG TPA: DinB family protein, partial [Pyrinomonadaceae bacterium]|nr:DinB family protein [Pyrinomonadaceae bacterium]